MSEGRGIWVPQKGVPMLHLSENVVRMDEGFWVVYRRKRDADFDSVTGKYLFFSSDFAALEKIAVEEIENQGFILAKINDPFYKKGPDFVLCLYYTDDSRKQELEDRYSGTKGVKYRYWKSNEETRKGQYSKQFQKTIKAERRGW